jgi:hypothetical protein
MGKKSSHATVPLKKYTLFTVCFFILRRPPADDGGTAIKHYVVDLLDTTTNNMWTTVAMSNTGEDRQLIIRYIFPPLSLLHCTYYAL